MDSHDILVHSIYDAATDSDAWSCLPERITKAFGGSAMYFADGQSHDPKSFTVNSFRFSNELLLSNGFVEEDHYDPHTNLGYAAVLRAPIARGIDGHQFYDTANDRQKSFFHNCFSDFGTPFVRSFLTNRYGTEVSGGFMSYRKDQDPFHGQNAKRFDVILTHLSRAVEIRSKLNIANRTTDTLGKQLDILNTSVIIIDRSYRVLYLNETAEKLTKLTDAIDLRTGIFRIIETQAIQRFAYRLRNLFDTTNDGIDSPISLGARSEKPALLVWVYPATGFPLSGLPGTAFACIVVRNPAGDLDLIDEQSLIANFDFTPAEARVAQLTPLALSIRQLAVKLGISPNTVKTHLSNARAKVSAQSTAELAQVVSKLKR